MPGSRRRDREKPGRGQGAKIPYRPGRPFSVQPGVLDAIRMKREPAPRRGSDKILGLAEPPNRRHLFSMCVMRTLLTRRNKKRKRKFPDNVGMAGFKLELMRTQTHESFPWGDNRKWGPTPQVRGRSPSAKNPGGGGRERRDFDNRVSAVTRTSGCGDERRCLRGEFRGDQP
jgi:hypothetical protein